jgi:predicted amidohydrolase
MDRKLRVGLGQMLVEGGRALDNLNRAAAIVAGAGDAGCDLVVLPECLDAGWTHSSAWESASKIPGRSSDLLCDAARSAALFVAAGIVEREGDKLYNSAVLISPEGEILLKHRKINELEIALNLYTRGESLQVTHTALGCVGLTICADNFPDSLVLSEALAKMGATLILSPCAWAVDADHDNDADPYGSLWSGAYSTLTRNRNLSIVGVSNVGWLTDGPWEGRKCIGCSMAYGPGAELLAQAPYGEDAEILLVAEVPLFLAEPAIHGEDLSSDETRGFEEE